MTQLKCAVPLLLLASTSLGIGMFFNASTERRRAAQVEETPAMIDCATLIQQGVPDNRHVRVTRCWLGGGYVYQERDDSSDWKFVYVPLHSVHDEQEGDGREVRLLAHFTNVRNEKELEQFQATTELTGFIWDDHRMEMDSQKAFRELYPKIDPGQCRVIEVGRPLPTQSRARMCYLGSIAAFVIAAVLAVVLVYRFVARRLGVVVDRHELDPYASESPQRDLTPAQLKPLTFSDICLKLVVFIVPATVIGGVASYCLMRTGIVSAAVGETGIFVCLATMFIVAGAALLAGRQFREHVYERLDPSQLSRKERRFFERHTPELQRLGFQHIADVKLHGTVSTCMREFLSADRKIIAFLDSSSIASAITFDSVMSDGVYLVTSNFDTSEFEDLSLPRRYQFVKGSPSDLLAAHRLLQQQYESENQVETLAIEPNQISVVVDYTHRVASWSMYRKGHHRNPPPPLPRFNTIEMLASLLNRGTPMRAGGAF